MPNQLRFLSHLVSRFPVCFASLGTGAVHGSSLSLSVLFPLNFQCDGAGCRSDHPKHKPPVSARGHFHWSIDTILN